MPLWKDPKTGKYRYQFQYRGQRYSRTGFDSQKAAKAAMAKHRGELEQPQNLTPPSPSTPSALGSRTLSLMELMVKHLRLAERELIPSTVSYRSTVFRRFHAHIKKYHGEIPAAAITKDMVEEYLLTRPTNHNFNKERTELMRLFTWAIDGELLVKNPVLRVRKLAVSKEKKKIPTSKEMAKILMAAGKDRPFLLVLFHTMGRVGEILRLRWEDVNFQEQAIRLWTRKRKGGNLEFDWLPMNEDLEKILWELWQKRTQDEWVFLSPLTGSHYVHRFTLMKNICERAGVPHYTYHTIRHFVASYLFDKKKVSLPVISKLLRHKNLQTTEIYLQAIDPRFRETMRLLEGNVISFLSETPTENQNLLTTYSPTST